MPGQSPSSISEAGQRSARSETHLGTITSSRSTHDRDGLPTPDPRRAHRPRDLSVSVPWYKALLDAKPVMDEDTDPDFHHTVYLLADNTLLGLHQHARPALDERFSEFRIGRLTTASGGGRGVQPPGATGHLDRPGSGGAAAAAMPRGQARWDGRARWLLDQAAAEGGTAQPAGSAACLDRA